MALTISSHLRIDQCFNYESVAAGVNRNEDYSDQDRSKRRRARRACDDCRRKKIRCDQMMANGKCTTCVAYNFECTYIGTAKKRGPPNGYVENLESRLEKLEKLTQRVRSSFMRCSCLLYACLLFHNSRTFCNYRLVFPPYTRARSGIRCSKPFVLRQARGWTT
ncbi:hypothetical protein BKA62DRAFT_117951 [Auriculariales sp. MPI-PUGE-AT-0066]|nr:hypothetical protein BKA62DRAFT_117951 [Auriculariales sp. MPI-PUGE-AT-0066]